LIRCIVCGKEAEYIYCGCSLCDEHFHGVNKYFLGFQQSAEAQAEFDPNDLLNHEWKGSRKKGGGYAKGSLSWGWDYRDQFKPETIKTLEKMSPLVIDNYEFKLENKIVTSRKIKKES